MGLFSKRNSDSVSDGRVPITALVITASAPPEGAPRSGKDSQGSIRVLVDTPSGRQQLTAPFTYADNRWLVAGMDASVFLDSARPDSLEVDWDAVPTMQQQVVANHPALADPFATSRRIAEALGITPSERTAAQQARFQQAVAEAGTKPSPPGYIRAVAMIATVRGRYSSSDGADAGGPTRTSVSLTSNSAAVLSVAVTDKAPYAVYQAKFKIPTTHLTVPGEPMPALVSTSDPHDVKIVWDEAPGIGDIISARMADSSTTTSRLTEVVNSQVQAAQSAPSGFPMVAGVLPPQMRQMLVENLRRSLQGVTDPGRRQLVLDQYRTMGLDISTEELGL